MFPVNMHGKVSGLTRVCLRVSRTPNTKNMLNAISRNQRDFQTIRFLNTQLARATPNITKDIMNILIKLEENVDENPREISTL